MAIVVSHIAGDFAALSARALRQAPLADLIELRLDRIGHPGVEALADFVRRSPKPVVVTCRGVDAGGEFAGSDEEQLDLLRDAAEAGARFVDVDWTLSLALGEVAGKCHRIVSRHDFEGTPDDLDSFLEQVRDVLYEGDVTKIATYAHTTEDGLRMLRFLRATGGGLIAFCMGPAGGFTRVLAPIFGAAFTYAAPAAMPGEPVPEATAPGQLRVNDLHALAPPGGLTPQTAVLGVVGRPVSGSWSPRVHGMALKAARLDAVYVAFEPSSFDDFLALADDENFRGLSVTAPFKEDAFRLADVRDNASSESRAANTLVRDGERWRCANTDVLAVRETLEAALRMRAGARGSAGGSALAGARVLVLGTGGAARAAVQAATAAGARATVAGRRLEAAQALGRELACESIEWDAVESLEYDALVHATPLGSLAAPGELPIPAAWIRPGCVVLDAVYRPIRTPLLLAAAERGCVPVPGGEWFVRQAREQFRLFTGQEPDEPLMRAAFEHALEEDRAGAGAGA